jgi:hypothetical protein
MDVLRPEIAVTFNNMNSVQEMAKNGSEQLQPSIMKQSKYISKTLAQYWCKEDLFVLAFNAIQHFDASEEQALPYVWITFKSE